MMKLTRRCAAIVSLLVALPVSLPVAAQSFPSKPLRLVVGFPPGGGSDTLARTLGLRLAEQLGQPVIVENRPGANGNIGAEVAAKLPADGSSLLLISLSQAINASLYTKLNYNLVKDFAPVAMIGSVPNTVVVYPGTGIANVKELIARAKKEPGKITYASSGLGSPEHLAGEIFSSMAGISMVHVPYKGSGQSVVDLASGHVMVGFNTLPSVLALSKSEKVRILAVTTPKRSPSNPEVPTVAEAAIPGFDMATWYALVAPIGTPAEVVKRLNEEVAKALGSQEMKTRMATFGADPQVMSPNELGSYIRSEIDKFQKIVKAIGVQVE